MRSKWRDRREAGRALAELLRAYQGAAAVVLALPRGGVPVAFEIAVALGLPLDLQLVRKVGAPGNREFGMGAVADGAEPVVMLDPALVESVSPPPGYVEAETARELAEMARRRERFLGGRPPRDMRGKTAIVVDDGIATGGTVRAALEAVRRRGASRVVIAVPVAAPAVVERLQAEADEVVCPLSPSSFSAVGNHYDDFRATEEAEVVALLEEAARSAEA